MKKNEAVRFILIAAGLIAAPFSMANEIGHGDPIDSQTPGHSGGDAAENFWQELFEWFLPEEDEVERDER